MRCDGFDVELEALTAFLSVEVDGVRHVVEWRDADVLARCLEGRKMRFSAETTEWSWDSARLSLLLKTVDGHGGQMNRTQAERLAQGVKKMQESYEDWRMGQQMDKWRRGRWPTHHTRRSPASSSPTPEAIGSMHGASPRPRARSSTASTSGASASSIPRRRTSSVPRRR